MNRNTAIKIIAAALPAAFFAALAGGMGIALLAQRKTIKSMTAMQQQINDYNSTTTTTVTYESILVDRFYEHGGQKILLKDEVYGQIWLPVLEDVPLSTHPLELLKEENDRMVSYDSYGSINAMTGIDISVYNEVYDWNAVKADGIDFVMMRVGYRTYGGGQIKKDTAFQQNYKAAKEAGLLVGAYFFSQAISIEEAIDEAIFTAQQLEGLELDFPVVYDWEIIYDDDARTDAVAVDVLTDCTLAFCQHMESFGYQPMIYQNKRTSLLKLDLPRIQDYPFWLAEYGDGPTYIYDYDMWQYTCTGTVDGIKGAVDINLSFYDYSKEGAPAIAKPATPSTETTTGTTTE
ncbi:MAG: glycoside hydrolase family 25 protein [Oscillospiraceae bacterium]|nr:glycoside hydrolase family 25 protein [Oscillospiraceae bacterium]